MLVDWAARTDRGLRRSGNEDAWGAFALGTEPVPLAAGSAAGVGEGLLFAVSDGIGGARAGEVASAFCIRRLAMEISARRTSDEPAAALAEAFRVTHAALSEEADRNPEWRGMGATLTVLWFTASAGPWFGHVGDSRLYLREATGWVPRTHDHSVGAGMVRRGELTPELARRMRLGSVLEQAMGGDGAPIGPQIGAVDLPDGGEFLLCTDGLHGPLDERLPAPPDTGRPDVATEVGALVAAALAAGGPDNVTVLAGRLRSA